MNYFDIIPNFEAYPDFIMPRQATEGSAAIDVFAQEDTVIRSQAQLVNLGFSAEFSPDYVCMMFTRSGNGIKRGIALSNGTGIIDADYPDAWLAAPYIHGHGTENHKLQCPHENSTDREYLVKKGEAIAQLVFIRKEQMAVRVISERTYNTDRKGGLGSTDRK